MRTTLQSFAAITGSITLLVVALAILSPVIVTAGLITTIALALASFLPGRIVFQLASKLADMQLAMGRFMARKVWTHMR